MKVNTIKKLAVSTMAIAMGAALVGSISGSVAWYQYSTRSTVAYSGASAHCTENLQVRLPAVAARGAAVTDDTEVALGKTYYTREADASGAGLLNDGTYKYTAVVSPVGNPHDLGYFELVSRGCDASQWASDLRANVVRTYLEAVRGVADYDLRPVTTGALAEDSIQTSFHKSPIYQYESTASWGDAGELDYVTLPLAFRVLDVNGAGDTFLNKKLYLTKLEMSDLGGNEDITNALRVGVDGTLADVTYSKTGADTNVYGSLDLNNDGVLDTKEEFDSYLKYTVATLAEKSSLTGMDANDLCQVKEDHKVYRYDGTNWDTEATDAYCLYGDNGEVAKSTEAVAANFADDSDPYAITGNELGTTGTTDAGVTIYVRIYLEGWQLLAGSASWDAADYVGSSFNVSMRFSVEAHNDH